MGGRVFPGIEGKALAGGSWDIIREQERFIVSYIELKYDKNGHYDLFRYSFWRLLFMYHYKYDSHSVVTLHDDDDDVLLCEERLRFHASSGFCCYYIIIKGVSARAHTHTHKYYNIHRNYRYNARWVVIGLQWRRGRRVSEYSRTVGVYYLCTSLYYFYVNTFL